MKVGVEGEDVSDGARLRRPWRTSGRDRDRHVVKLKGWEGGLAEALGVEGSLAVIGTFQEQVPLGELEPRGRTQRWKA